MSEGANTNICLLWSHDSKLLRQPTHFFFISPMCCENIPMATSCGQPGPMSQFSTTHTYFQSDMLHIHKHKTTYIGLLGDPLYNSAPSCTLGHLKRWWWVQNGYACCRGISRSRMVLLLDTIGRDLRNYSDSHIWSISTVVYGGQHLSEARGHEFSVFITRVFGFGNSKGMSACADQEPHSALRSDKPRIWSLHQNFPCCSHPANYKGVFCTSFDSSCFKE